jgi:hypothetical protein
MRIPRPAPPLALLALILASLVGCTGDTHATGTPTPLPSPAPARTIKPTPTPTPTPTGPVRAPDDPNWTENQLAAVHLVDALNEWSRAAGEDLGNADRITMIQLTWEPLRTTLTNTIIRMAASGRSYFGGIIPVIRVVGPEQVMDGRAEIVVRQCEEDAPGSYQVDNGETLPPPGNPRVEYRYVVQWVEEVQGWRVVEMTKVNASC